MNDRRGLLRAGMIAVMTASPFASAQPPAPAAPAPRAATTDVHVNDSLEAQDAIAKAEALAARERWTEAAVLLQRTGNAEGEKLLSIAPRHFISVRTRINRLIASWPRNGIDAYRASFEGEFREAAARAWPSRQLDELLLLFERYFCTEAAGVFADRLGQLAMEVGDLALAEAIYRTALQEHPDASTHAPGYRVMLAIIEAMSHQRPADVPEDLEASTVQWMGGERTLKEILEAIPKEFGSLSRPPSPLDWPIFGGSENRNRTSSSGIDELGLLWRFTGFEETKVAESTDQPDLSANETVDQARQLSLNPVVAGGFVFVQHDRQLVALHRGTGAVAWRVDWRDRAPGETSLYEERPPAWDSPTYSAGRLYASLPGDQGVTTVSDRARNVSEIICLDAETGRLIWRLEQQAVAEQFAEILFESSPIVREGRLLVIGRRRRSFGFEDCYLYRFDADSGKFLSRTHLGSASTGTFGSRQPTMSVAAMHGDTVYACSNLGTVAAVSAMTGTVKWLRIYQQERSAAQAAGGRSPRDARPWHFNPALWFDGKVLFLPNDAAHLLVMNAEDGRLLDSIPTADLEDMQTMLGVRGGVVCGVGRGVACYDVSRRALQWSTPLPGKSEPHGRGVWIEGRILVPTQNGLSIVDSTDGRRTDVPWGSGDEGGNLLALPDQLIVAGVDQVSGYVRRTEIWKTLRDRMAAAPADPIPALELTEVAQNNGEYAEAMSAYQEAARRAFALGDSLEAGVMRRLYDNAVAFAARLHAQRLLTRETLDTLLESAGQNAPDPPAHVAFRLQFAEWLDHLNDPAGAIGLYQQLLRDRSLRDVPVPVAGEPTAAATLARDRIAAVIQEHGRESYSAFEAEAGRWLEAGRAAGDETTLTRVVATFPNSNVAPLALIARGELLAARGDAGNAAKQFASAYHRYPKQVDRPALLRKIADVYEAAKRPAHAYQWLTKAWREHPAVRFEFAGRQMTFLEYRDRLSSVRHQVEPSRPNLSLPLSEHRERSHEGPAALLMPRFPEVPDADWSRYLVAVGDAVCAFESHSNAALWKTPMFSKELPQLLIATQDQIVFSSASEVFALDARTGDLRWMDGDERSRPADAPDDWEQVDGVRATDYHDGRLLILRNSGQMTCVDVATGRKLWRRQHRPGPVGRIRLSDEWIAYPAVVEGEPRLCLIDPTSGAAVRSMPLDKAQNIEELFVTLDNRVLVVGGRSLASFDPESGQRLWQVALAGQLRRSTVAMDVDALYLSDDGHRVTKIGLEDGVQLWESESLSGGGADDLTVTLQDGFVLVSSGSAVGGLDAVTGLTLWRGTTPEKLRFVSRLVTRAYVVAIDVSGRFREGGAAAFFYDHRNASGVIPENGGVLPLGNLTDFRNALAVDGALVIQDGTTIHVYASK